MSQSNVPPITQNFGRPSWRPEAQSGGLDPDMRRMALIAAGLGGAVALVIGAVSLSHRVHHGVPVIEAAAGPVRVKPLDPGGMKVAGAEEAASGVEALGPVAERPALRALHAKIRAAKPQASAELRPPVPLIAATPPAQKASILQPLARPLPPALPLTIPQAPLHSTEVQLAAFETQQAAEQAWGKLAEKTPGLLGGHRPEIERADVAGRIVYRLRTGGFRDIAAATAFCGKLRARGSDCSIAAF